MQSSSDKLQISRALIASLLAVVFIILITNFVGKEVTIITGNLLYVPLTVVLVILSIITAIRFRGKSAHGIAWLMFALCASSWLVAEHIWIVEELVYHENPFPSKADIFYVTGYLFLILFSIYYLKIVKNAINKKTVLLSSMISFAFLIPSIYMTLLTNSDLTGFALALAFSYPILDAIVLVPALIGVILFFRGKVNLLWTLTSLAIISLIVGDTGFLITQMNDSYYTGHPIEIMFYWSYILFSFGVYSHIKIFKNDKMKYSNKEDLR